MSSAGKQPDVSPCEPAPPATAILNWEFIMLGTVSRASGEVLMEARSVSEVFLIFRLDGFFCGIPVPRCGRWGADTGSADQGTPQLRPGSNVANMPPPSANTRSIGPLGPARLLGVAPALRDKHDLLSRWVVDHRRAFVNFALRKLKVIPRSRCRPQIFAPFFAPALCHLPRLANSSPAFWRSISSRRSRMDRMWNDARCADRGRAARGAICAFRTRGKRQWRECPTGGKKAEHQT